jgi:hypothetical protein
MKPGWFKLAGKRVDILKNFFVIRASNQRRNEELPAA